MTSSHADFIAQRRVNFTSKELERKGWYHSIEFPDGSASDGVISLERLRERVACMPIPQDLRGFRVLDIGAWDGWFSFEMERRGADVVAVDCIELDNFVQAHERLNSKVEYRILDLMELSPHELGTFDIVLFLGVLYHLKHPLLGLEKVCEMTRNLAIVESHVVRDPDAVPGYPRMEFYEHDELCEEFDNWFGPSADCLAALCRTAGFARVDLCDATGERAAFACYRKWEIASGPFYEPAPVLSTAMHYRDYGINFKTTRDDYISYWFSTPAQNLTIDSVFPEAGDFAVKPLQVRHLKDSLWAAAVKLPPGLSPGWHEVRLRTEGSPFSNAQRIAVDIPLTCEALEITGATDGRTWSRSEVTSGFLSFWIRGLPETADRANVRVMIDGRSQPVIFVSETDEDGVRQVNSHLRPTAPSGMRDIWVQVGEVRSNTVNLAIRPEA